MYAILPLGKLVLITHQQEPVPEYQLPGGGISEGEFPLAALFRESLEETGWKIEVVRRMGAYRRFVYIPEYEFWARKTCTIYIARPVMHKGPPTESFHTALWVTPEQAIEILDAEGDREMMRRFARGINWPDFQ